MYGIFTYIYHKNQPNVGKSTIHGSYGNESTIPYPKNPDPCRIDGPESKHSIPKRSFGIGSGKLKHFFFEKTTNFCRSKWLNFRIFTYVYLIFYRSIWTVYDRIFHQSLQKIHGWHGDFEESVVFRGRAVVFHLSGFCDGQVFGGCQDCCGSTLVPLEKKKMQNKFRWKKCGPKVTLQLYTYFILFSLGRFLTPPGKAKERPNFLRQ